MWVAHNLSEVMGLPLRSAMPTSSLRSQTEYPFCGSIQCAGQTPVREDLKEGNWMTKENLGTASTSERKLQRVWKSQLLNPPRTFQVSIEPLEFKGSLARTHTRNAAGSSRPGHTVLEQIAISGGNVTRTEMVFSLVHVLSTSEWFKANAKKLSRLSIAWSRCPLMFSPSHHQYFEHA